MNEIARRISSLSTAKQSLLEKMLRENGSGLSSHMTIPKRQNQGAATLSFAQERLWFLDHLEPGSSAYNMAVAFRLTGDLRTTALEQSLSEILRRHEVLRTTFVTENDQPVQMIAPPGTFTLPLIDLGVLPEEQREAKVRRSRIFGNKKLCL